MSYFDNQPQIIEEGVNDYFNLYPKTELIHKIISSEKFLKSNIKMVALYGGWGTGKTSVMLTLQEMFAKDKKIKTELFEAWKYEKDDNLPLSMMSLIARNQDESANELLELCGSFLWGIAKGVKLSFSLPFEAAKIDINAGKGLQEAQDTLEKNIAEKYKSLYGREDDFIENFSKLIKKLKGKSKKLIVFIDDLDRCEPEGLLNLMATIKNFFTLSEDVIFVCGVDKKAVETAIKTKYKKVVKAEEYLEKIFDFTFDLPVRNSVSGLIGASQIISDEIMVGKLESFLEEIDFTTPRKVKKLINKLVQLKLIQGFNEGNKAVDMSLKKMAFDFKNDGEFHIGTMFIYLLILKLFYPDKYEETKNLKERVHHYANNYEPNNNVKPSFQSGLTQVKHLIEINFDNTELKRWQLSFASKLQIPNSGADQVFASIVFFFTPRDVKELSNSAPVQRWLGQFERNENKIQIEFCEYLVKNKGQLAKGTFPQDITLKDFFNVIDEFV